jgi:hypothetical protein
MSRYYTVQRAPGDVIPGPMQGDWFNGQRTTLAPVVWVNELSLSKTGGGVPRLLRQSTVGHSAGYLTDVRFISFCTPRLAAGQTTGGTLDVGFNVWADLSTGPPFMDPNARWHIHAFLVGSDGTIRGTLINNYRDATTLFPTPYFVFRGLEAPVALASVVVQEGDRIVVEVGAAIDVACTSEIDLYYGTTTSGGSVLADGTPGAIGTFASYLDFSQAFTEAALPAAPDNDDNASHRVIASLPYSDGPYDTTQAANADYRVFYAWTAPTSTRVMFTTFQSNYASAIFVRGGSPTGMGVDEVYSSGLLWNMRSHNVAMWDAEAGTTYYIEVFSYASISDSNGSLVANGGSLTVEMRETQPLTRGDLLVNCKLVARYTAAGVLADIERGLWASSTLTNSVVETSGVGIVSVSDGEAYTGPRLYVALFGTNPLIEVLDLQSFTPAQSELAWISDAFTTEENLSALVIDRSGNLYAGFFGDGYDEVGTLSTANSCGIVKVSCWDLEGGTVVDSPAVPAVQRWRVQQEVQGTDYIDLASDQKTIFYSSAGRTIYRFDTETGTQLDAFATLDAEAGPRPGLRGLRLLPPGDGSGGALVCYGTSVKRINAAGVVIQSYVPSGPHTWANAYSSLDKIELAPPDVPGDYSTVSAFWVSDQLTTTLFKFDIESGAQLDYIDTHLPQGQLSGFVIYDGYRPGETPDVPSDDDHDFDVDGTGSVAWRAGIVQGTPRQIRRLRQSPHLSAEKAWLFYSRFQLECETGVGLASGQGAEPMLMLQWSKDHGHTWSNEVWVSAGKHWEYRWRAIWRRLGRSRDLVFRVVVSDPVKWALLNAYLDVEKGTS